MASVFDEQLGEGHVDATVGKIVWAGIALLLELSQDASGGYCPRLECNAAFRDSNGRRDRQSGLVTRSLAMMNGAIYDVFQAVNRTHQPFLVDLQRLNANIDAAASQAAHDVLQATYPNQAAMIAQTLNDQLAIVPAGPAKQAGIELGQTIAQQYLNWRGGDGATNNLPYQWSNDPGRWRPDPLHPDQQAWGPAWGAVTTFSLISSDQFPVPGVPNMNSQEYTDAFNQVVQKGSLIGSTRTNDETQIGLFWAYDRPTMGPPPVLYSQNLDEIGAQAGNTAAENARLFAMASVAMADAAIAAWDYKFQSDFWRPVTAIREADTDGNPNTVADPNWIPLGAPGSDPLSSTDDFTPPFPAYTSGHATMGGATFETLRLFYGTDAMNYVLTSAEMPADQRQRAFSTFSQAEFENAISRVYLGIHWSFDVEDGVDLGNQIGQWVHDRHFQPVPEPVGGFVASWCGLGLFVMMRRGRAAV